MKKILRGCFVACFFSTLCFADISRNPYLQNGSPSSMEIMWRTDNVATGLVEYGTTTNYGSSVSTGSETLHGAELTGLTANTKYFYRVNSDGDEELSSFRTFPTGDEPIQFAILGDSRHAKGKSVRDRNRFLSAWQGGQEPRFVLHTGDIVDDGDPLDGEKWQMMFDDYTNLLHRTPLYIAVGNHEYTNTGAISSGYLDHFSFPTNGPDPELIYSFDCGMLHVTAVNIHNIGPSLDTNYWHPGSAQFAWATNDLATTDRPWKIFLIHNPIFSSGKYSANSSYGDVAEELIQYYVPEFEKYGVNLVVSGHDHLYERSEKDGTTYLIMSMLDEYFSNDNTNIYSVTKAPHGAAFCSVTNDKMFVTVCYEEDEVVAPVETFVITNQAAGTLSISITEPTTASSYTATQSTVAVKGITTGAETVTSVMFSVSGATTTNGTAGTTNQFAAWETPSLGINSGTSLVTVTAYDQLGDTATNTMEVVFDEKPTLSNGGGATDITIDSAMLHGNLIQDGASDASVFIYWGGTDGEMNKASWSNEIARGTLPLGVFSNQVTITPDQLFYYRCYASNSYGEVWATSSESFSFDSSYTIPFAETFETEPSTMAGTLGSANAQHGWVASPSGGAVVQTNDAYSGAQGCRIEDATLSHAFSNALTNVWIQIYSKPQPGTDAGSFSSQATAVFWVNTNQQIVAYSNATPITLPTPTLSSNQWSCFLIHCNYEAKKWSLWVDGTNALENFGFYSTTRNDFFRFNMLDGNADATSFLDDISVGVANPTLGDTDSDGLPDEWEMHWWGNLNQNADTDSDNDGVNNFGEYISGTNPTNPSSVLRLGIEPFSGAESSGFLLRWESSSNRFYNLMWETNLTTPFGTVATNLPATPPQNSYTDTLHSTERTGFYNIDVRKESE